MQVALVSHYQTHLFSDSTRLRNEPSCPASIEEEDWYHDGHQQASVDRLRDMPVGAFFLRNCSNTAFLYTLDFRMETDEFGNCVGSKRIMKLAGGMYTYEGEGLEVKAGSIRGLLAGTAQVTLPAGFNDYKI